MELVVIHPFDGYDVGTPIADKSEIERILTSDNEGKVVKILPLKPEVKSKSK